MTHGTRRMDRTAPRPRNVFCMSIAAVKPRMMVPVTEPTVKISVTRTACQNSLLTKSRRKLSRPAQWLAPTIAPVRKLRRITSIDANPKPRTSASKAGARNQYGTAAARRSRIPTPSFGVGMRAWAGSVRSVVRSSWSATPSRVVGSVPMLASAQSVEWVEAFCLAAEQRLQLRLHRAGRSLPRFARCHQLLEVDRDDFRDLCQLVGCATGCVRHRVLGLLQQ